MRKSWRMESSGSGPSARPERPLDRPPPSWQDAGETDLADTRACHEPADYAQGLVDGGLPPGGLGPGEDRRLLLPPPRGHRRAQALVARALHARPVRIDRRLRRDVG